MSKHFAVEPARLRWEGDEPFSLTFDDRYYCGIRGIEESRYLFLQHNGLPQRWQRKQRFTIAETGFGTGLNFLATWRYWRETAPAKATLHFLSFEKYPLRSNDLKRALSAWPELRPLAETLCEHYPPLLRGFHRLRFDRGRVVLTLLFGDVAELLPEMQAIVDAWYLDGFDPAKNPQMWEESLFRQLAAKSAVDATFATFTAAGWVRRGLQAAGFEVQKSPGFDRKREMLHGRLPMPPEFSSKSPWFEPPPGRATGSATVIGAGFAGAACAHTLAQRGWRITLLETAPGPACKASGNPAGLFYPALTADYSLYGRFYLSGYLHALHRFKGLRQAGIDYGFLGKGVLHLAHSKQLGKRQQSILQALGPECDLAQWAGAVRASELSGIEQNYAGLFYPHAAWMSPALFCRALLSGIECRYNATVHTMKRSESGWHLLDRNGESLTKSDIVVIATGAETLKLPSCDWLPLTLARGQLTTAPATQASSRLKLAICHEGYLIPAVHGRHCIGATYTSDELTLEPKESDEIHNLALLQRHQPHFHELLNPPKGIENRVGLRATTPDRLPLIGPLPDRAAFLENYAELHHGRRPESYPAAEYETGLFLMTGLGSRGLISALLGAELLACQIGGEPLPLEKSLVDAVSPARFLVRELKRRNK